MQTKSGENISSLFFLRDSLLRLQHLWCRPQGVTEKNSSSPVLKKLKQNKLWRKTTWHDTEVTSQLKNSWDQTKLRNPARESTETLICICICAYTPKSKHRPVLITKMPGLVKDTNQLQHSTARVFIVYVVVILTLCFVHPQPKQATHMSDLKCLNKLHQHWQVILSGLVWV